MTEDQLHAMSEAQIRARYGHAPAYYLEAKLEKKRLLETRGASAMSRGGAVPAPEAPAQTGPWARGFESSSLDISLPGFEILDAALGEVGYEAPTAAAARAAEFDRETTQHAILQAALEDYSKWPFLGGRESDVAPAPMPAMDRESEHARTLELVLDSDSDLDLVLESESDPDRVLASQPDLDLLLESESDLDVVLESESDLDVVLELEPDLDVVLELEPDLDVVLESESDLDVVLESERDLEPERGLQPALPRVLASQPAPERGLKLDLDLVLESEPDLDLVLEPELDLDRLIESLPQVPAQPYPEPVPDNVTVGKFRPPPTRKVRVVTVVRDRKRPNMVRVIGETTRRAG